MKNFIYKWFWEGKQKWVFLFMLVIAFVWIGSCASWELYGKSLCNELNPVFTIYDHQYSVYKSISCSDWYLDTLHRPLTDGFLLKAALIASLLILPFSSRVFVAWIVMSSIFLPWALYRILFVDPIMTGFFTKKIDSDISGDIYLALTVIIIVVVSLGEWVWKKYKRR